MDNVAKRLKEAIGGLTEVLILAIGLLVVVQIVYPWCRFRWNRRFNHYRSSRRLNRRLLDFIL